MRHHTIFCASLLLALLCVTSSFAQVPDAVTVAASRQVKTSKSGNKTDVLKTELLNFNICPTRGTLNLLETLNPQLKRDSSIAEGTSVILPLLSDVDADVQKQMNGFLTQDKAIGKTGNALFRSNSMTLRSTLAKWLKNDRRRGRWMKDLQSVDSLLQKVVMRKEPKLRKYHTDILNSELERFTGYLNESEAKPPPVSLDTAYVHSFRNYFYEVAGPYYLSPTLTGSRQQRGRSSGLAAVKLPSFNFSTDGADPASTAVDAWIHVLIPVFIQSKFKYIDSMNQYWVYCLSEFQFDNLNRTLMKMKPVEKRTIAVDKLSRLITVNDLEKTKTLCPSPASVTAKRIDTRFPYHFIVVSLNKKEILIHDWIDLKKYSFQLKDGLYGLGLYQNINWSQ